MTQKITPFLWFDKEAREAAILYASLFRATFGASQGESKVKSGTELDDTPSGTVEIVSLSLLGQDFSLMSAGPLFKFNPSVSFLVACQAREEVDALWKELSKSGKALIELGEYPFSPRNGWVLDRYGLSWQVMFMGDRPIEQNITPVLMFVGMQCGKAEEAIGFYASVFHDARVGDILRRGKGEEPDKEGSVRFGAFTLENQVFAAMDSAHEHDFAFNEAISFVVNCKNQEEIDYYWGKLSADPKAEQCGWLKDKYGLSWQIVPTAMEEMLKDKDKKKVARVTEAFLKMKKFDIAKLVQVYEGD